MLKIFAIVAFIFVCVEAKGNQKPTPDSEIIELIALNDPAFYNAQVRPSVTVSFNLGISYRQLVSVDEKAGIMTSTFYLTCQWNDQRLLWDPKDSSLSGDAIGTTEIVVPATKVRNSKLYNRESQDGRTNVQ